MMNATSNRLGVSPEKVKELSKKLRSARDRDFLGRVWKNGVTPYLNMLEGLELSGLGCVLDAGCGFGLWSFGLAELNQSVVGVDIESDRITLANTLASECGISNLRFLEGSIDNVPLNDCSCDAIFSFSAIYYTDYVKTIREFARILRPGGQLYFCTNGFGWYLYNLLNCPNPSEDFSPRLHAIETLLHTLRYRALGQFSHGKCLVMSPRRVTRCLTDAGFTGVETLRLDDCKEAPVATGIYPTSFYGFPGVYEVIARKS